MSFALQLFILCAFVQCLYYLLVLVRLNFVHSISSNSEILPPVSIIICAKNEAENLLQNLKIVLIQQYKQYEVIVVNDQSTDNTIDILVEYYVRNENFKLVNIEPNSPKKYAGKKHALLKGIEAAAYDTIVVTDADCRPATTQWLAKLAGAYMNKTKFVLGHSPFEKQKGFLNKFIRYENFMTALQYFGFAKAGLPYMGVGRNMSYKKEMLKNFNGFDKNKNLLTGDDDLLVNAKATCQNTEICIDKDAFVYTKPEITFKGWFQQKRRHLRSGFSYKLYHQFLLFLLALSNFLFYGLFVFLLVKIIAVKIALFVFAGVLLFKFVATFRVYNKLEVNDLKFLSPVLDIFYILYLLIIFFLLLLKPKTNWRT